MALLEELSRMMRLTRKSRDPHHRSRRSVWFPKVNQALLISRTTIPSAANEWIAQNKNKRSCHDKLAQFVIHVGWSQRIRVSSIFFFFLESIPCCLCPRNIPIITFWKTRVAKVTAWILIISFRNQFQFLVHHSCNGRIDHGKTQTAVWNPNRGEHVSQPGSSHF